jgi:hypothetical protein
MKNLRRIAPALFAAGTLAACSHANIQQADPNPTYDYKQGPGLLSGKSGNILDAFKGKGGEGLFGGGASTNIGVNIYLWRAALEAVGFMPLTQADSNGGVIVTDWYVAPENPAERVKVNILILGKTLRSDAIKATVFKQRKDARGNWVDAPADVATSRKLEDTILTKARAIKVQTQAAN